MQMNGSSRRRAGSDSHLNLAKTFLFARTSLSHHKSSVSPHSTTEASSKPQQFVYKGDSKLHTFDSKEAPWPYSFNREVLELWVLSGEVLFFAVIELCLTNHLRLLFSVVESTMRSLCGPKAIRCLRTFTGTLRGDVWTWAQQYVSYAASGGYDCGLTLSWRRHRWAIG